MRLFCVALFAGIVSCLAPSSAEVPEDERLMEIAYTAWAGINCGDLVPMDEYYAALQALTELGDEKAASYRRRVEYTLDKETPDRKTACKVIGDARSQ